jgi:hypothetical protein
LCYDYQIQRDNDDPPNVDVVYACRCGAKSCRGSMLEAAKKPRKNSRRAPRKNSPRKNSSRERAAREKAARRVGARNRTARRGD